MIFELYWKIINNYKRKNLNTKKKFVKIQINWNFFLENFFQMIIHL